MNIKLKIDYTKEYLPNKDLKAKVDNIAIDLTALQYSFGDDNTFGKLINSDLANRIDNILPVVIPVEQYNKYDKLSNNAKRKTLIKGIFGAFRNKLVCDKNNKSKKSTTSDYYSALKISGWDLLKQIYIAIVDIVTIDKSTNTITIK